MNEARSSDVPDAMTPLAAELAARLVQVLRPAADPDRAAPMAAYMKHLFPYLGIPATPRRQLQRTVWAGMPRPTEADVLDLLDACWALPEREFQYAGLDYIGRWAGACTSAALPRLQALILDKSWWDTVDALAAHGVGALVRRDPSLRAEMDRWLDSGELWLVRSALIHQLAWRADMDIDWIEAACLRHAAHRDFFVRKAIGWALRSYANQNQQHAARVRGFLAANDGTFSGLSAREAVMRVRW